MATTNVESPGELWKDIPGYEDQYQISNMGRVKSLARSYVTGGGRLVVLPESMRKQTLNRDGYPTVGLSQNGIEIKWKVHRLVAITFIANPHQKECIDHINAVRSDNRASNLRWCSRQENMNNHLTLANLSCSHKGKHQVRTRKVAKVDPDTMRVIYVYDSALAAGRSIGVSNTWICKACKAYPKLAHGFYWQYIA